MTIYQLQEHEIEQQREKTLAALEMYKSEKYKAVKVESIPELLYTLLNEVYFPDYLHKYQEDMVSLLSFILKPSVVRMMQKEFSPMFQEEITSNLHRLYHFFRCLANEEYYTLLIKAVEIEYTDDCERLRILQRRFNAKLTAWNVLQESEKLAK